MNDPDIFAVSDYRTLMGAFIERKKMLGLTNLDIDDRGRFGGGYTSKLFCGSKRLGLETLGRLLEALDVRLLVVPKAADLSLPKLTQISVPTRDLAPLLKEKQRQWGKLGGLKRLHLTSPARRSAIACMGGRASAEARRIKKLGITRQATAADPAILRRLERRPNGKKQKAAVLAPVERS